MPNRLHPATFTGLAAVVMHRSVTVVVFVVAGLTFTFGFGNGYAVGVQLGVPAWIAPLVASAVDLSVVAAPCEPLRSARWQCGNCPRAHH